MFDQTKFINSFVADITNGLSAGDALYKKLQAAIKAAGDAANVKALRVALYKAAREKSDRHYTAARKLGQTALSGGGKTAKPATAKPKNAELVAFLRASASVLAKGGDDFPAEIYAMLVDCQLAFEDQTA